MLADLGTLLPLEISEVSTAADAGQRALFENLLHRHHYLSYRSPVGENLKYLVSDRQGRPVAELKPRLQEAQQKKLQNQCRPQLTTRSSTSF